MIQERAFWNVFNFPNPLAITGLTAMGQVLRLDSDAPFRCFGVAVVVYNGTSGRGSIALRFSRGDEQFIQKILTPVPILDPFDTGNTTGAAGAPGPSFVYYAPLSPNVLYQPDSAIDIDIQNLPLNSSTVVLVIFVGTKLFKPGSVWCPPLPENYTTLPALSYPLQIASASLPAKDISFQPGNDAGLLWQYGTHTAVSAGGGFAHLDVVSGEVFFFTLTAVVAGAGGNLINFTILAPVGLQPLSIAVVGNAITVTLQTNPSNSTTTQVAALIAATPAAAALVTVSNIIAGPMLAVPTQFLAGGGGAMGGVVQSQLGLKIRDYMGKPYMNDFVPIDLLFGFDNAQIPGFPYPEIYIPRQQLLLIDAIALGTVGSVTTLCFKGQKIYG